MYVCMYVKTYMYMLYVNGALLLLLQLLLLLLLLLLLNGA